MKPEQIHEIIAEHLERSGTTFASIRAASKEIASHLDAQEAPDRPVAWLCCDERYPIVNGIVTTNPDTVAAWRDSSIEFRPLAPYTTRSPEILALADRLENYAKQSNGTNIGGTQHTCDCDEAARLLRAHSS